ncbi:MAG TPA: hypothetical protein VMU30_12770 [Bacteroidota bacterium]|nr:hypothetical protein [Bacteroidota bacterium]
MQPLFGLQARYQPSSRLKLLFGVPVVLAAEWTACENTDIGMEFLYTTESLCYIRQRLSNSVSISAQYHGSLNNSDATYFENSIYHQDNNHQITYNNITFLQHQIFASIDLKLYKDVGFSIGAGYNLRSNMSLYNNTNKVLDGIKSSDNFFINCSLQFVRLQ